MLFIQKMKKVNLIDLVGKDVKGIKADVRRQGGKYHYDYQDIPMIRTLEKVVIKKEKGEDWIYWYWIPEMDTTPGLQVGIDCGYSGIADSDLHRLKEAFISIAA